MQKKKKIIKSAVAETSYCCIWAAPGCATVKHNHPNMRSSRLADDNLIKSPAQVVGGWWQSVSIFRGEPGASAETWSKDPAVGRQRRCTKHFKELTNSEAKRVHERKTLSVNKTDDIRKKCRPHLGRGRARSADNIYRCTVVIWYRARWKTSFYQENLQSKCQDTSPPVAVRKTDSHKRD